MTRRVLWTAGNTGPGEATLIVATDHTRLDVIIDTQTLNVIGVALDPTEVTGLRDALTAWLTGAHPTPNHFPGGTP